MKLRDRFTIFSHKTAFWSGHPLTFIAALLMIVIWAISGPMFGFSNTWQLVINTGTTIITFLMVFLIQSTQNRDSEALHLKIDELLRATPGAHLMVMDLEKLDEEEFDRFRKMYDELARKAYENLKRGQVDTDCPDILIQHPYLNDEDSKTCG